MARGNSNSLANGLLFGSRTRSAVVTRLEREIAKIDDQMKTFDETEVLALLKSDLAEQNLDFDTKLKLLEKAFVSSRVETMIKEMGIVMPKLSRKQKEKLKVEKAWLARTIQAKLKAFVDGDANREETLAVVGNSQFGVKHGFNMKNPRSSTEMYALISTQGPLGALYTEKVLAEDYTTENVDQYRFALSYLSEASYAAIKLKYPKNRNLNKPGFWSDEEREQKIELLLARLASSRRLGSNEDRTLPEVIRGLFAPAKDFVDADAIAEDAIANIGQLFTANSGKTLTECIHADSELGVYSFYSLERNIQVLAQLKADAALEEEANKLAMFEAKFKELPDHKKSVLDNLGGKGWIDRFDVKEIRWLDVLDHADSNFTRSKIADYTREQAFDDAFASSLESFIVRMNRRNKNNRFRPTTKGGRGPWL